MEKLAEYIHETAIPALITDLKQLEGIPMDSASLTDYFHKRGINMRYLGKVIERLPQVEESSEKYKGIVEVKQNGDFKHIKTILEREVLMRSAKHVFNRILREESGDCELHLAKIVSHLLNCLLAPIPFFAALNSGKIKNADESLQTGF